MSLLREYLILHQHRKLYEKIIGKKYLQNLRNMRHPILSQFRKDMTSILLFTNHFKDLIESPKRKSIVFREDIFQIFFDLRDLCRSFSTMCKAPKTSYKSLFDPSIKYLLISKNDRKGIHMRISLECLPVYLSIDETLECILRCSRKSLSESIHDPLSDHLYTIFFESIFEVFTGIFFDSCAPHSCYSTLYLSPHPLLCESETSGELSIFSDEIITFGHENIISYFFGKVKGKNYSSLPFPKVTIWVMISA